MIYKLLYWLFKKQLLKIYYLEQSKKKGFEGMEKKFIDSNTVAYYVPVDEFDMPHLRTKEIQLCVLKIIRGLSDEEIDKIMNAMEVALGEGKKPNIAKIGHLIIEMRKRKEMLLHPDLLLNLVSYHFIREDEDPCVIDKEIHRQKIEQFKKDSQGGLRDFFLGAGLNMYIPYLTKLPHEWDELWETSTVKIAAMNQHLEQIITK